MHVSLSPLVPRTMNARSSARTRSIALEPEWSGHEQRVVPVRGPGARDGLHVDLAGRSRGRLRRGARRRARSHPRRCAIHRGSRAHSRCFMSVPRPGPLHGLRRAEGRQLRKPRRKGDERIRPSQRREHVYRVSWGKLARPGLRNGRSEGILRSERRVARRVPRPSATLSNACVAMGGVWHD
jgi:hypothetical protein